jgi:hypothetical protein
MTAHRRLPGPPTAVVALLFGLLMCAGPARADDVLSWYAGVYPQNQDWIEVQVDTRGVASNVAVKNVDVSIGFYDATGDLIGGKDFVFSAVAPADLVGGFVYQQFFPNPYPGAMRVTGLSLRSSLTPQGSMFLAGVALSHSGVVKYSFPRGLSPGGPVVAPGSTPQGPAPPARQATLVFNLPADGTSNANGYIGPFCCTGHTATVTSSGGDAIGYIYAFDAANARTIRGGADAAAPTISVLLSGVASPTNPSAGQATGAARFDAAGWSPGSVRTVSVGALTYAVTLQGVVTSEGGPPGFEFSSLNATVRVAGAN